MSGQRLKYLCAVGNIGPESIQVGDKEPNKNLGGTLTRVAVVAASLGQEASIFGSLQPDGLWEELQPALSKKGINTEYVKPFDIGIEFALRYKPDFELIDLCVTHNELQGLGVALFTSNVEKLRQEAAPEEGFVTYICPLPPEMQKECVDVAKNIGSTVALTTHFNLLENPSNLDTFKDIIPKVDLLSLSGKEAMMVADVEEAIKAGSKLSGIMEGGLVFVTCGEEGVYAFQNQQMIASIKPDYAGEIVDVTGAGDVFFATTLIRMMQGGWDGKTANNELVLTAMREAQQMVNRKLGMFGFSDIVDIKDLITNKSK